MGDGSMAWAEIRRIGQAVYDLFRRVGQLEAKVSKSLALWAGGGSGGGYGPGVVAVRCATTTGTITAKSGGVAGSGPVTCADIDPDSLAVSSNESLTVANFFGISIPSGVDVFIGWCPNLTLGGTKGVWCVIQRYCS
jgi:hypothetical protein